MKRFSTGMGLFMTSIACFAQLNMIDVTIPLSTGGGTSPPTVSVNVSTSGTLASPTIRNLGSSLIYGYDIAPIGVVNDLAWSFGWIVSYGYTFEIINDMNGLPDSRVSVSEVKDLTGTQLYNGAYIAFPTSADYSFSVNFSAQNLYQYNGTSSYTLFFRVYDTACSANNSGWASLQHQSCIALQIPVKKFNLAYYWRENQQPPPSGTSPPSAPVVYKKIQNRPLNANPPQTYPVSTFLYCDANARCQ